MLRTILTRFVCCIPAIALLHSPATAAEPFAGSGSDEPVAAERNGFVIVEAEAATSQSKTHERGFYLTSAETTPGVEPDGDPPHLEGAGGGAYLEILPDTRRTHADPFGYGFSNKPNKQAVLTYPIEFTTAGRYYVWVRAYSTGSEDNGLHVGLDGDWPESGQRLQWCAAKDSWRWESKQRTDEKHCGVPGGIYLDVAEPGLHEVAFSMREDGFEFDQFLLTTDPDFARPDGPVGDHPAAGEVVFGEDFENGLDAWEVLDPATWTPRPGREGLGFEIVARESDYRPPHKSPKHIALIRDLAVGDFEITFRVRSTKDTGGHRDCCVFFGWQDPANFYYAHLGAKPDPRSGQIMLVDDAPRRALTENTTPVPWTDGWHTVRLVRDVNSGEIAVYFDDLENPLMSVADTTFAAGRVGIGSFDDMNVFDDLVVSVPPADGE